jgi:hypothetical protein
MKYLVSWTARAGGSAAENEATLKRTLEVYGKWTPPADAKFLEFLTRADGSGGYAVVETDNVASVAEGPWKFGPYFEFEIVPVLDVADGVALLSDGIAFRDAVR